MKQEKKSEEKAAKQEKKRDKESAKTRAKDSQQLVMADGYGASNSMSGIREEESNSADNYALSPVTMKITRESDSQGNLLNPAQIMKSTSN